MVKAIKTVLQDKEYLVGFIILSGVIFFILFQIQVKTIPGNDPRLQASIFGLKDWLFLVLISGLNSLFLVMQVYINRLKNERKQTTQALTGVALSGLGTSSGIFASIFGTASCALCVSAIFGFLGTNAILFLVNYKDIVSFLAIAILLTTLIVTSQRLETACEECKVR